MLFYVHTLPRLEIFVNLTGLSQLFVDEYHDGLKTSLFCIVYFITLLVHVTAVGTNFAFRGQPWLI